MSVAWTIEHDGNVRPLAAWGVRSAQLTFRSLDVDELSLYIPREDVLAAPAFAFDDEIVLRRDGVTWFRGRVAKAAAEGGAAGEGDRYTIYGPWWQLARLVYQQPRCVEGVMETTPRVTLGQNQFAQRISVGRQIREIVLYALSKAVPIAAGVLPEFQQAWLEEAADMTCAGAIIKQLRFCPDAAGSFDYTGSVPILNIRQRSAMTAVTLDATAGDTIAEFSGLARRDDLVPAGVTLIFESRIRSAESDGGDGRTRTKLTRQNAGATNGVGAIVACVPLKDDEAEPAGLALQYYSQLQVAPWEGTIRTLEEDCTGVLRPGKVVNISNGRAEWANMRAVIQLVTEDLITGETIAELGAAEHLAPQDFVEQQQLARRRHERTAFPLVQTCQRVKADADPGDIGDPEDGVEPDPEALEDNEDGGIDPGMLDAENNEKNTPKTDEHLQGMQAIQLSVCMDGEARCIRVIGSICG